MSQMPEYPISRRVHAVWKKLSDWYGADVIAKHFGAIPPREWCDEIDAVPTRQAMDKILAEVRTQHPTFPPRFPQFESIVARLTSPVRAGEPSLQEQLCDYVLRTKRLTDEQIRRPWTYIGQRVDRAIHITGVIVPADGDRQGYRVMVADMQLEDAA